MSQLDVAGAPRGDGWSRITRSDHQLPSHLDPVPQLPILQTHTQRYLVCRRSDPDPSAHPTEASPIGYTALPDPFTFASDWLHSTSLSRSRNANPRPIGVGICDRTRIMDEDQNNQHHHDGHINLDPHTSPHDLTPEQMQQIQQILRALPPVSADLFEPIELADVGGIQPHIQIASCEQHDAALALPLAGLSVPAPHHQDPSYIIPLRCTASVPIDLTSLPLSSHPPCFFPLQPRLIFPSTRACRLLIPASDTFTAYPSTSYTLYTVPTVPLGQAQTDTDYRNGIHINLALGQSFGIGPTLPASGPVSAPVPVPVSGPELRLPAWQYDPTPVSQNLLNEDYILPPTWSRTTGTDASATTAAAGPKLLYPVVPSSSASSFAPLIPGSVYPQNTPPTQHPSAISFHPRQHLHGGTISPELVRSSRPFVEHTNQQQYHPLQHHLPVQYHPSLSLPLPPIAAAQGTSSVPLDSGVSHPLPQTQPWLDVELIFPSLSTSVPYLPPVQHGITSTPSHLIAGGEPYADITAEMESGNWRDWNGGDGGDGGDGGEGGDGGDGLSDVSESKDEDEDEDGRYTPGECGGVAVGDELESEDGSEAYHDGDGGYDTEHEHEREHEHDHKYKHNEAADDHTDTDDDDGSESSFSATSHLSDPLLVPSSAFPSPPRTPTQAAGVTPHSNATPRHLTMRDQDSHATPSSSDPHIGTPALRQAIGVGTLHVTLSTDSDGGASPPQHGGGAVTIKPCVEPMMYTTAEYPIPEEMWEGEEEVEMKVEVEVDVDVAGEGNVANGEEALREPTGELARGRNENGVDQSSNVIGAKQAKGTTRSKPRARSIQHVQVSEQGDPEVDQSLQAQVNKESESFDHPRSRPKFDEACGDSSGSEPDTGSDANPSLKDPTYQPRFGPTTRSFTRYQPQTSPSHRTNGFWTGPLRAVVRLGEDPASIPTRTQTPHQPFESNPKSIKKASARISNKVLVTGSGTGSTVPWSQSRTKAAGPRRNHKKLSDEARTNVESLRERLEATAFRSHINFDEKVFRALVDERFTEYIHWAELDTGEWGVVIPRENEVGEGSSHLLPGTLPVLDRLDVVPDRLDVVTLSRMIIFPLSPSQTSSHYHTCRLRTAMRLGGESLAWD
ncbi:hypothetical protein EHS25_006095 [Saitozyma podzolica]|uniref:Uncharacterized protein n=1 Tax=Saitozyma podzolica TaxID=1890683 RepID=A0A427XTD1_9TREE|nr:hypothetical protein EHS25_006095 [Saitozyma podzolica]